MPLEFGARRGSYIDISKELATIDGPLGAEEIARREKFDLIYRSLCALLYNYVPMSGHPGGSISSGRFVAGILFGVMNYDVSDPDRPDADLVSYAAGHKALGLYAMWALRNEVMRIGAPELLPANERHQLRLEDLLGFRRNPVTRTPLYKQFNAKPLDGHPTPATPFLKLSTGASGVGVSSSLGLAFAARDYWGEKAPRVHVVEGEGGLTPGRVAEAMAAAGTSCIDNAVLHIDWNQASIDSNRVCREDGTPGDYVQWDPIELAYLHDWNVIYVPDGFDLQQIFAAQRRASDLNNGQPTAIVYKTVKGWQYGIEGRASHGAGHKLCSEGFYEALKPLTGLKEIELPQCCDDELRCSGPEGDSVMEECFWSALTAIRETMASETDMVSTLAADLKAARERLAARKLAPRANAPKVEAIYETAARADSTPPPDLVCLPGTSTTLRGILGKVLDYYNRASDGAIFAAAADLLGSTSVLSTGAGFPEGYYNAGGNPQSRILSLGGICEDAMSGILSGIASYGRHIGAGSSYGAFIAPLGSHLGPPARHRQSGPPRAGAEGTL